MHLKSPLLEKIPGVIHGFGSITEPVPALFAEHWEARRARWKQVHQTANRELLSPAQECGEIDAQWSGVAGLPVATVHADCTPILLARRDGGLVAAVHAGWRGTRSHILRKLWHTLAARGERAGDWVAAVGPTIGPCCYEVSEELAQDFAREFANYDFAGSPAEASESGSPPGSSLVVPSARRLDLPAINAAELRALGFAQVDLLRACTQCSRDPVSGQPRYHSYRREKGGTRQYSVIARGCI